MSSDDPLEMSKTLAKKAGGAGERSRLPHKKQNNYDAPLTFVSQKGSGANIDSTIKGTYEKSPPINNKTAGVSGSYEHLFENRMSYDKKMLAKDFAGFGQTSNFHKLHNEHEEVILEVKEEQAPSGKFDYIEGNLLMFGADANKPQRDHLNKISSLLHGQNEIKKEADKIAEGFAWVFMVFFKVLGLSCYYLLPMTVTNIHIIYQAMFLFLALDFWTVKNVCGRILIGLRWWCEFTHDGEEEWVFECRFYDKKIKKSNERCFWYSQIMFVVIWIISIVMAIIEFNLQLAFCLIVALLSTFFNCYAFYKCARVQKVKLEEYYLKMGDLDKTIYTIRGSIKLPVEIM